MPVNTLTLDSQQSVTCLSCCKHSFMQACRGYHQSQPETLLRKNNGDSITASIKYEESGWMHAPAVDGQLVHHFNGTVHMGT